MIARSGWQKPAAVSASSIRRLATLRSSQGPFRASGLESGLSFSVSGVISPIGRPISQVSFHADRRRRSSIRRRIGYQGSVLRQARCLESPRPAAESENHTRFEWKRAHGAASIERLLETDIRASPESFFRSGRRSQLSRICKTRARACRRPLYSATASGIVRSARHSRSRATGSDANAVNG
jgi:hypothetical protein